LLIPVGYDQKFTENFGDCKKVEFLGLPRNRVSLNALNGIKKQLQFITNGPDIPDALLQAHKEGRVVFFLWCWHFISRRPAGLQRIGRENIRAEWYRVFGNRARVLGA
jgi:hypothetical protein